MSNIWAHLRRYWRGVALLPAQQQRLEAWLAQPAEDLRRPFAEARYVVVDVESTGLDLQKDRLIAIGAVAVVGGRIDLAQSFEVVLRQDQASSRANILIHGIGGAAQREGQPPVDALLDFLEFLGPSPLVAFHVAFDSTMIGRAMRAYLGINLKHPWLDLAYAVPGLLPQWRHKYRALDDWTGYFGIGNFARHSALADALATAQLLLVALPLAKDKRSEHYRSLQDLEQSYRWVTWQS
jgi:DNA polymerase-3 subunit epsilon